MKNNTLVSIVIPCYNQAQYLEEAVQSALDQSYPDIEIVIVNDGSPDNTEEIAKSLQEEYSEKIIFISQENSGVSTARNNGIRHASGNYIVPLDADDILGKEMVKRCMETLGSSAADIVYTGYQGFGVSKRSNMWKPFEDTNPLYMTPCSPTALYKKKVWRLTGGYNSLMRDGYEDWEYWVNAYKCGMIFMHIPEQLYYYRRKDLSRDTEAVKKDAYLKALIVLLHPEMYPISRVQRSIDMVKKTERLADLYFFVKIEVILDIETIARDLGDHIWGKELNPLQIVMIKNKPFKIIALGSVSTEKEMEGLLGGIEAEVIFYSEIPCIVPGLKLCPFSWSKEKGIAETSGTVFPYLFKSKREDPALQRIACERMERFEAFNQERIRNFLLGTETLKQNNGMLMEAVSQFLQAGFLEKSSEMSNAYNKLRLFYQKIKPLNVDTKEDDSQIVFTVEQRNRDTRIAFYLYRDGERIDTKWYGKDFSYRLNKQKYGKGKYQIQYFIINGNIENPNDIKEKEIGYSKQVVL